MNRSASKRSITRVVLVGVLVLALIVLAVVAAVLVPILTHTSSGGSGQQIPGGFVAESSATGADGRTRVLSVESPDGTEADLSTLTPGEKIVVRGSGFDASIGIYVSICAVPENAEIKPGPCLGGIPEGAKEGDAASQDGLSSAWVTNDWAWRAFASHTYENTEDGTFEVRLAVPEPTGEGLDCTEVPCAIVTRSDHTAASDRVQDMLLPVAYK